MKKFNRSLINIEEFRDVFISENMTRREVASYFGISERMVKTLASEFGIKKDPKLVAKNSTATQKKNGRMPWNSVKQEETMIKKYGVKNNLQLRNWDDMSHSKEANEKRRNTMKEKYGVENFTESDKIHNYEYVNGSKVSKNQRMLFEYLKEKYKEVIFELNPHISVKDKDGSYRTFIPDIYLPEHKIDIEVDGSFFHDSDLKEYEEERDNVLKNNKINVERIKTDDAEVLKKQADKIVQEKLDYYYEEIGNADYIILEDGTIDEIVEREYIGTEEVYDIEVEDNCNFILENDAVVHNSRGGGQVVFASVNFGLDTSKEGRLVSKCLMQAQCNGLGHGETPIFPILIVKVKEGINYNPEDPNYDIFKMSMEVTAKRLFPNWVFEDSSFNADFEDLKDAVATMGCIDYDETITISQPGEKELTYKIGDFFKNQEKGVSKQSIESKAERFARFYEKQGDIERASKIRNTAKEYYTGINQWAKKFSKDNGRKPTKGDFEEYFGRDFPRHKNQRKFDSSLFNLWDSYLELKVKSYLDSLGYSEKNTLEECTNNKDYCRNKYIGDKNNKSFQADFCIPSEKLIIEVQDFATHDKELDDASYYQRTNEYKHGPSYHKEKRDYFATFGYKTIEMWEDEIKSNNFKELN